MNLSREPQRDSLNIFTYLGAVHWAEIDYGLSTGQLLLTFPNVKVKEKVKVRCPQITIESSANFCRQFQCNLYKPQVAKVK